MTKKRLGPAARLLPLLLCLGAMPIQAASSLGELVQAALARNPGAALSRAQRDIGQALQRRADHPLADAPSVNIKYQTDQLGADTGYREWEGGVDLPLWLPGQAEALASEAEQYQRGADVLARMHELAVSGELRERLWSAALTKADARQAELARDTARQLFDDVERRVAAGELPRSDSLLAEKDLVQREQALQAANSRAAQAIALWRRYTGLNLPTAPVVETPTQADQLNPRHPRLMQLQQGVDQARAHRNRVRANRQVGPNLWLGGKSTQAISGSGYDNSVGMEISMPIGGGAHGAPELAKAEAALTEAQVEQARAQLRLEDDLTQARLQWQLADSALAQSQRRADLAEQSLKLSRRAFELGETDLIRLLQAQSDALSARQDQQAARLRLGQAIARLNQTQGVVPQ